MIRHADVENPNKLLYGHLDGFDLSALGRAQAAAIGDRLRDEEGRRIVHSPLARAVETARLINARLARPAVLRGAPRPGGAGGTPGPQGVALWQRPHCPPRWVARS